MKEFPQRIRFTADQNELELISLPKGKKGKEDTGGQYEYVVSETKKGDRVTFDLEFLKRMQDVKLLQIL